MIKPTQWVDRAIRGIGEAYLFGSWARRYVGERGAPPGNIDVVIIGNRMWMRSKGIGVHLQIPG